MMDILPREDLSGKLTSDFLKTLGDTNWKIRKESLDQIESKIFKINFSDLNFPFSLEMIIGANKRIGPNVGNLMTALKGRLGDTNKNLVIQTLELLSLIATVTKKISNHHTFFFVGDVTFHFFPPTFPSNFSSLNLTTFSFLASLVLSRWDLHSTSKRNLLFRSYSQRSQILRSRSGMRLCKRSRALVRRSHSSRWSSLFQVGDSFDRRYFIGVKCETLTFM